MAIPARDTPATTMAISSAERAIAATAARSSGTMLSMEKLGYRWEQNEQRVRISFSLPGPAPLQIDSIQFDVTSVRLRVSAGAIRGFFDCQKMFAACNPELCSARVHKDERIVLDIAKAEAGQEWPSVRA